MFNIFNKTNDKTNDKTRDVSAYDGDGGNAVGGILTPPPQAAPHGNRDGAPQTTSATPDGDANTDASDDSTHDHDSAAASSFEPVAIVAIPKATGANINDSVAKQVRDAVEHDRQCTLTIGEAQDLFRRSLRRPLSQRSLQRYCNSGTIAAEMISHSQGKEWMLNEASLLRFIERYPITLTEYVTQPQTQNVTPHPTAHPARQRVAPLATETQTPLHHAVADSADGAPSAPHKTAAKTKTPAPNPATSPANASDKPAANSDTLHDTLLNTTHTGPDNGNTTRDDTNDTDGGDTDDFASPAEAGEKRRIGDLLIENARLTALLEGNSELIQTLKLHEERTHEDLKHSRTLISKLTDDVRDINSQMLDTMLNMATGRQLLPGSNPAQDTTAPKAVRRHRTPDDE